MGCSNSKGLPANPDGAFVDEIGEAHIKGEPVSDLKNGNWLFRSPQETAANTKGRSSSTVDDPFALTDEGDSSDTTGNVHGTIWRVVKGLDGEDTFIKLWACVEDGMVKYYRSEPTLTTRAMGYLNLHVSRIIPPLTDAEKVKDIYGHTMFLLTLAEQVESFEPAGSPTNASKDSTRSSSGSLKSMMTRSNSKSTSTMGATEFVLALDTETKLDKWAKAIQMGINGEKQPPTYLGHNLSENSSTAGTVSKSASKLVTYPFKSGTMKKKAIGKKLMGIRNWKVRYFKLEAGDLRYYRDKSYKSSSLKGFLSLKDSPSLASTQNEDLSSINIPVPVGSGELVCKCSSEIDALDWIEKINESIKVSKQQAAEAQENGNSSGKSKGKKKRKVIALQSSTTSNENGGMGSRVWKKQAETAKTLEDAVKNHFLFKSMGDFSSLLDALQPSFCHTGDCIIWQGDEGDLFYILEKGECEVVKNGTTLSFKQRAGTAFGELALIHGAPRACTIRATQNCKMWSMNRSTFRKILNDMEEKMIETQKVFLKKIKLFQDLSDTVLGTIAKSMKILIFKEGEKIIKQNEIGEQFYMIRSGEVMVSQTQKGEEKELVRCKAGDSFGELALMHDEPRKATVTALEDVECFALERSIFNEVLGSLNNLLELHKGVKMLKNVKMLAECLSQDEMEKISDVLVKQQFKDGAKIVTQGETGDEFFMIEKGSVTITIDSVEVGSLCEESTTPFFGEMAILNNDKRVASVIADGDVETYVLSRENFNKLLGPLSQIIKRESAKREEGGIFDGVGKLLKRNSTRRGSLSQNESSVKWGDLSVLQVLGSGTFGLVKLVEDRATGEIYALKALKKQRVTNMHQERNIFAERDTMNMVSHPLVLKLHGTFHDANQLYMLMDLCPGGELWTLMHGNNDYFASTNLGGLKPEVAKFYASNVLSALEALHKKQIAYRDLKPENLCIDSQGYLKLIDMGFATVIAKDKLTNTLCGTPEYLAPELVLSKGHNCAVDMWALGILIYELLTNSTPFENDNQTEMFNNISNSQEVLKRVTPSKMDKHSKSIIGKFLHPNSMLRFGSTVGGFDAIWSHKWFDGFTPDLVARKALNAPYKPDIDGVNRVCNFDEDDSVDDLEQDDSESVYTGKFDFRYWGPKV